MKYCPKCKETKSFSEFKEKAKPRYESDRYFSYCNPCATTYKLQHRAANIEEYRAYQGEKNAGYRQQKRRECIERYGGKCVCCGIAQYEFLAFDHKNNDGAAHRKETPSGSMLDWLKREGYPDTIQLLCHNCNNAKGFYGACPGHEDLRAALQQEGCSGGCPDCIAAGERGERNALIEKVEGMRKNTKTEFEVGSEMSTPRIIRDNGYNQALDDLLTHLRGEENANSAVIMSGDVSASSSKPEHFTLIATPTQEATNCCEKCRAQSYECGGTRCPCHKPRTEGVNVPFCILHTPEAAHMCYVKLPLFDPANCKCVCTCPPRTEVPNRTEV